MGIKGVNMVQKMFATGRYTSGAKKLVIFMTIFALTAVPVLAANTITVDDVGLSYGTATGLGTKDIRDGIMAIIRIMLSFLGVLSIVIVLYGGFIWLTSGGSEEKVGQAKKIIGAGIIGLVIIFTAYAIATFVVEGLLSATGADGW